MIESAIARPVGQVSADEVQAAVKRYHDALNTNDVEAAVAAFTEDGVIDCTPPPDGKLYEGSAGIRELFGQLFDEKCVRTFETEELVMAGDRVVVRWRHHWVDAAGRRGHVRGIDVLRVRDGKIAEKLAYVKG
ncbi:MAG: nuclear transport factor 2 family protein [Dehalococcoidia bacterium]